jgi:hypothetical protein
VEATVVIVIFSAITCVLAVAMVFHSAFALRHAERAGHHGQAYVLPFFVGLAYAVLTVLTLHDAAKNGQPREAVQIVNQLVHTMLILSVILMIHRLRKQGD